MVKTHKEEDRPYRVLHEVNPMKFRVPIAITPTWKIKAISEYKRKEFQKENNNDNNNNNNTSSNSTINTTNKQENISLLSSQFFPQIKFNVPDDHIKRELDNLNKSSQSIKKEMIALSTIRVSLLWLLKKTNIHETMRNHTHT